LPSFPFSHYRKSCPEKTGTKYTRKSFTGRVYVALGISQNKLARDLDAPVTRINDIIHFRRGIKASFALRLGKYFKTNAEFWINL
jgi:addiction module HigA family antidote